MFTDAANGDLSLRADSPAIDAGGCGDPVPLRDITGNNRIDVTGTDNGTGNGVDIGAYEYHGIGSAVSSATCG
jgi:hypothetical protein